MIESDQAKLPTDIFHLIAVEMFFCRYSVESWCAEQQLKIPRQLVSDERTGTHRKDEVITGW